MKDKEFDRFIKEKLEQLRPASDASGWELFEQKLTEAEAGPPSLDDRSLDQTVFQKLHAFEAPYNADHWAKMVGRLEYARALTYRLIRYKLVELALLLLLSFGMTQYFPFGEPEKEIVTTPVEAAPQLRSAIEEKTDLGPPTPEKAGPSTEVTKAAAPAGGAATPPPRSLTAAPGQERPIAYAASPLLAGRDRPAVQTTPISPRIHLPTPARPDEEETAFAPGAAPLVNTLKAGPLAYEQDGLDYEIQRSKQKVHLRVSMFGGADYNRIRTPDTYLSDGRLAPAFDRYTAGYSGGITVGAEFGRLEIESGAIYAAKTYRPRQVVYVLGNIKTGYYGEGIKDIELNILQVPLNFRYHFLRRDKWRVYALAGFSLQVAFQANYYVADQNAFDDLPFFAPIAPGSEPPMQESSLDRKNLAGGWFEGGTFEENGYLTGNVGLGLERYLSSRWSLFAQPTYQHSINYFIQGLGPDQDRINTFSIFTGVRVRL